MKIPETERQLLFNSTFMTGLKCSKRLWLYRKRPELRREISVSQQMVLERGTNVGKLAQQLFPDGKDATPKNYFSYPLAISQTYDWILNGKKLKKLKNG